MYPIFLEGGQSPPLFSSPVLLQYRFLNIYQACSLDRAKNGRGLTQSGHGSKIYSLLDNIQQNKKKYTLCGTMSSKI